MSTTAPAPSQRLVITAAMAAAVFVCTLFIRITIPATGGYLNFGDGVIIIAALMFGPLTGAFAGGIGSGMADIVGFPVFALPTLLIKGVLGLIVGVIGYRRRNAQAFLGVVLAEIWMVTGYFITEAFVFRKSMGMAAATSELAFNLVQGGFGVLIGFGVYMVFRRRPAESSPVEGSAFGSNVR